MTGSEETSAGAQNAREVEVTDSQTRAKVSFDPESPPIDDGIFESRAAKKPEPTLESFRQKRQEATLREIAQTQIERADLHTARKLHTAILLAVSLTWIVAIVCVVLLQGFGRWFIAFAWDDAVKLHFELSNSVLIAFITSTTATILGLYGIAAYWLYGHKKPKPSRKNTRRKPVHGDRDEEDGDDDQESEDGSDESSD